LLAGRKLLLADDSITIQKVVELTFADEGLSVVCVNNGAEAIERLAEFLPDIVLADVFMPQVNGYELCEYVKQNDKLKHIPVMLLVGSFEPFDEAEARRVGANDTLTKPFQSIRRLIEKVGMLVSNRPPEEQIPTAELPKPEVPEPEVERLSMAELEITTADTQPLPAELRHVVDEAAASQAQQVAAQRETDASVDQGARADRQSGSAVSEKYEGAGEVLLDLGEVAAGRSVLDDEFVLDIDLDEVPEASPVEPAFSAAGFRSRDRFGSGAREDTSSAANWSPATVVSETIPATPDQLAPTQEFQRVVDEPLDEPAMAASLPAAAVETRAETGDAGVAVVEQDSAATVAAPNEVSLQQLSPEMIDAIARRAVEHMSEKVVQEIAWEVVPQLAELLIKRQLEEKSS